MECSRVQAVQEVAVLVGQLAQSVDAFIQHSKGGTEKLSTKSQERESIVDV